MECIFSLREAPPKKSPGLFWALPEGGVSTPARMVWGTYLVKKKGICLFLGGLDPCQDGLGHLCSENLSSISYFLLLTRDLRLARILCGTYIPSNSDLTKSL